MLKSGFGLQQLNSEKHVVKVKRSLLRQKSTDFIKISKTKQAEKVRNINYLDLSSQCSKVIDFGQRHEKKGRPPHKSKERTVEKQKHKRKKEVYCQTDSKIGTKSKGVIYKPEVVQLPDYATTTVTVLDKEQWEKRKKSIKAKLRRENLLTKDEEQDIHLRADIYAITTIPDSQYYILPQHDCQPCPPMPVEEITIDTTYPAVRKKRRRNYGTADCYVYYHLEDDVYDNTRMLPIGTRLMKPLNKLVELVAQAIDGSPDGLLQVQQIYTYLQNRYPYFRYMERGAINSWRSSIRHALYQKWFRKIRFDSSFISCKGCYWTINTKSSPREWTMPPHACEHMIAQDDHDLIDHLDILHTTYLNIGRYLQDQATDEAFEFVSAIPAYEAQVFSSNNGLSQSSNEEVDIEGHIPSPVREPDPVLATCAPDWISDDVYYASKIGSNSIDTLYSTRSTNHTLLSPSLSSPVYSSAEEIQTDLQLGTPINSPVQQKSNILSSVAYKSTKKCKNKVKKESKNIEDMYEEMSDTNAEMSDTNEDMSEQEIIDLCSDCGSFSPDHESMSPWKASSTLTWSPTKSEASSKIYIFGYPLKQTHDKLMNKITLDIDTECPDQKYKECYSTFSDITGMFHSTENSSDTYGSSDSLSDIDCTIEYSRMSPQDISDMVILG